ncbi:MAG: hypothetical protein ACK2UB_11540, partial [Anaerolineales bacterium]
MLSKINHRLRNISDWDVMLFLAGMATAVVIFSLGAHFQSGTVNLWAWADSFLQNFGTEMIGAFLTFYLIEVLRGARREREEKGREEEKQKQRLIHEMGRSVKDV